MKDKNEEKITKTIIGFNKKVLLNRSKTLILIAVVILIYIGINMWLDSVILPEFDITKNKLYSLSDETISKIKNIEEEVMITLVNIEGTGEYEEMVSKIEKYMLVNDNIKYESIQDISVRPDLMEMYGIGLDGSLVLISSEDREEILSWYQLYTVDYTTYEYVDTTEEAFTNAIVNVTVEEKPVIYFMTNHTLLGVEVFYSLLYEFETEANIVNEIDLLVSGEVPEDCNVFVITTLKEDILEVERDALLEYIDRGGNILLLQGTTAEDLEKPNFDAVLQQYGLSIENGIVFEQTASNMINGIPNYIVEDALYSSLTDTISTSMKILMADAVKLVVDEEELYDMDIYYEPLVQTSQYAFLRKDYEIQEPVKTEQDGDFETILLGAYFSKTIDDDTNSELVVYANEMFVSDYGINLGVSENSDWIGGLYNNMDVVLNSVAYLNERVNSIMIRKVYDEVVYTITEEQHNVIMATIFTIPVSVMVLGILVWQARMKKGNKKV